ncbi:MAG: flagellar motor switch protein FliN [Phycisphaerales bacterium JB043]
MPDEDTPTPDEAAEEAPQPEGASEEAPPGDGSEPANAAEQLAQDALAAAKAAVDGVDSDDDPEAAQAAIAAAQSAVDSIGADVASSYDIPNLDNADITGQLEEGLDLLSDVNLNVKIELGRTRMFLEDVLKLSEGSVVELDKLAGDPVDVYVNERHVATGEVLILNDNFCVRVNEIVSSPAPSARAT